MTKQITNEASFIAANWFWKLFILRSYSDNNNGNFPDNFLAKQIQTPRWVRSVYLMKSILHTLEHNNTIWLRS